MVAATALVLAALFGYFWYAQQKFATEQKRTPARDFYVEVTSGQYAQDLADAQVDFKNGKIQEGIALLNKVKAQLSDPGQRSIIDLSLADAYLKSIDKYQGSEKYAEIAHNDSYPKISRAYAELVVVDQFTGYQDKELLKPFFSAADFSSLTGNQLASRLRKEIYGLYPFGYAAGNIAFEYLLNIMGPNYGSITDDQFTTVMQYMQALDKDLANLDSFQGMKTYIPVTLQTKAKVYRLLEHAGRPLPSTVESVYQTAIARSRTLGMPSTEQFSMLGLADYYAQKNTNKPEVVTILSELSVKKLDAMVIARLSSKIQFKNSFPFLNDRIAKDKEFADAFAKLLRNNSITQK